MTPPSESSEPRRSFVKKTLATSVSISFAGLIRILLGIVILTLAVGASLWVSLCPQYGARGVVPSECKNSNTNGRHGGRGGGLTREEERLAAARTIGERHSSISKLGATENDAIELISEVGVEAVREYLAGCGRPLDSFQWLLADQIVHITSRDSVYAALQLADDVGLESIRGKIRVRLVARCILDNDPKEYAHLLNHRLSMPYAGQDGVHQGSEEYRVVDLLVDAGMPISEITRRYKEMGLKTLVSDLELWAKCGNLSEIAASAGGPQQILDELEAVDPRLRSSAVAQLHEPGVSTGDYLRKNGWIVGKDRWSYLESWMGIRPVEAFDWLRDNDPDLLQRSLASVCRYHPRIVAEWSENQKDPQIRATCAEIIDVWKRANPGRPIR